MGILKAFLPFIAFALVDRLLGSTAGLVVGAVVALVMLGYETLALRRSAKLIEIGTAILFGGLALYAIVAQPGWSVMGVRLRVDSGLLLIVLASLAVGRPFTLQYAREQTDSTIWETPEFKRVNVVITAAWAVAFAIIVVAEYAVVTVPGMSPRLGVWAIIGSLAGAFWFTGWYPEQAKKDATLRN